jgi:hypothetical protein
MAKGKRSSKSPQARHKRKGQSSRFDKRKRLNNRNTNRRKTRRARVPLAGSLAKHVAAMAGMLDSRIAFRLAIIISGMLLADDRRVAAAWFTCGGVQDDWDRFYDALATFGRQSRSMALPLLILVVQKFVEPGGPIRLALDDSPTKRFGKHVEGAGVHHNPTPGPADGEWMYGHNWVSLCFLAVHPLRGVVALPLRSLLYVRLIDVPALAEKYGWKFQTKHTLAIELVTWFVQSVRSMGVQSTIWLAVDGAYAAKTMTGPLRKLGVVMFSRLRKDSALFDLPGPRQPGQLGRTRTYGKNRISLAKRAAHKQGWETIQYQCRGVLVTRQYKTFLATSRMAGGVIRVVLVSFEDDGWAAYFCTDSTVTVQEILETVSARWAIEEHFHDVKEVWGAGEQQVRNVWSNIGCWHLNQWMYTLVELCSWDAPESELADRTDRPWDNPDRRPSHADKRRAITKEMLKKQFLQTLPNTPEMRKFRRLMEDIISLSA